MPTEVALEGEQLGKDGTHADVATHMRTERLWESGAIREELPDLLDTDATRCDIVAKILQLIEGRCDIGCADDPQLAHRNEGFRLNNELRMQQSEQQVKHRFHSILRRISKQ